MTDFASFRHGGTTFPLDPASTRSLLRDADPGIFYALEYYASIIETHIGARLLAEAGAAEATHITSAVAETLPLNPEPFLTEDHLRFPLLAVYRKGSTYRDAGTRKVSVDALEVVYVLPPLKVSEAERVLPILKAVAAVIDNRTEQGFDPSYTPSEPTGTAGELVWALDRAGVTRIGITSVSYGGYAPTPDLYFPAVVMSLTAEERSEAIVTELDEYTGADAAIDLTDSNNDQIVDFVEIESQPPPVLVSIAPDTGTKAGGTSCTLTCTGLIVGRSYRVLFEGSDASDVLAVSSTILTCVSPQYAATPTFAAGVTVLDQDSQPSNTLEDAFTFTTP